MHGVVSARCPRGSYGRLRQEELRMEAPSEDGPPDVPSGYPDEEQESEAREGRESGGDAPAAGSVAEREAVASDDDELFGDGDVE